MKTVAYSKQALKALRRMPVKTAQLIQKKMTIYAARPEKLRANVARLQGSGAYRLRVGDWRVIFTEEAEVIAVIKIAPRGSAYS